MAWTDQLWRNLLKRITSSTIDYFTGWLPDNEDDVSNVVSNDILSWWTNTLDQSSITPSSTNQSKQSAITVWNNKSITEQVAPFVTPIPTLFWEMWTIGVDTDVSTEDVEQAYWPRTPIKFELPEIDNIDKDNNFWNINITKEEIEQRKKEEDAPKHESTDLFWAMWEDFSWWVKKFFNWDYVWMQEAKIISDSASWLKMLWQAWLKDTDWYEKDIQALASVKIWVENWDYTQEQYESVLWEVKNKYKEQIMWFWLDKDEDRYNSIIDWDVSSMESAYKAQAKINKLDPSIQAEQTAKDTQINTAVSVSMEKITPAIMSSNLWINSQEFVNDAYAVFNDQYTRWVNALSPVRRVKTNLISYYWTEDTSQYSESDKAIMDYISKAERTFQTFVNNYWNRVAQYPQFANKATGKLIVPDVIDWVNLHDAIFAGTDFLTNEDYWESAWLWRDNASAQDVLSTMSANISNMYSMWHWTWFNKWWTSTQRGLRPVWVVTQELAQQSLWRLWLWIYNLSSSVPWAFNWWNYWYISFDALNQDATLTSTLNTNNSLSGRLLQQYMAKFMEYTPEVVWEFYNVFKLASIPNKIRNASRFRAFINMPLFKPFELANKTGKWYFEVLKELWEWSKVAWLWLRNLNVNQRFWRFVATDAVPELVWDQMIDASLSSADFDFGSDVSMAFSLWGTVFWTLWVKMWEAWLFQMWKNWLNMIKENAMDWVVKTTWMDWTVWKVLNTLSDENMDALVKATYNRNSHQLATWEELKSFTRDFKVVSDTVKSAYLMLSPQQKEVITRATKWKMWDALKNLINQVYWADSQFANRIRQLIADDRTNPADIFKYALWVNWQVEIWWWKSQISLVDWTRMYVHWYNERLDVIPWISSTWFWRKLREWFTEDDLKNLSEAWVDWAKNWSTSWNFKENNGRYYFTKKGLDNANDIRTSSLDVVLLSKISESAEDFDSLMRNSNIKKISDKTLQDIKDSWAYDTLADALAELEWLCWIKV